MRLKVLLPTPVLEDEEVAKVVAGAENGSFCLLPRHVDFAAVWRAGHTAVAVNLNVDYRRPVPLNQPVSVTAQLTDREERTLRAESQLRLADGTPAVVARGIYVEAPQLFMATAAFRAWSTDHATDDPTA